jgi:rubrerythrin
MNAEQMYKMCLKKRKYKSEKIAQKYAKECDKKYGGTHRVYYCPLCGYYHLTTKELRQQ